MPKAMTEAEIDPIAEQVDQDMMESGEGVQVPQHKIAAEAFTGDLSDGGRVGRARLTPVGESGRVIFDKDKREPGRPTVRVVWTWDGRQSTIPLAYEPSGKRHDGGRRYLLKRKCTVCGYAGFYGPTCPMCKRDGRELAPPIPAFYLRYEQVPKPQRFYGNVDCFVETCIRRGQYGFPDETQMRQHAMGKHRMEYRAYQDSRQGSNERELAELRAQVAALTRAQLNGNSPARSERTEDQKQRAKERMAKARAARRHPSAETAA